ncbi:MAG: FAD-dependent oxidoreductase [Treponema sp.]|jgi:thioredoxin reductase (NADPH)|nr:FAD-dependent oxidoreductase [Treponema sp.]
MDENLYDAIIVGGGPAGLTAALYLARARYRVLVVEKEKFGGQITITADVVNYPGILHGSGTEITAAMQEQARSFGAEFMIAEVTGLVLCPQAGKAPVKTIQTSRGELQAFGIILATGANPRSVGFSGEAEFKGRGVAYCATCDGEFFTGLDVFVIGGGFAAAEEAVFLTKYARRVIMLIHSEDFTCAAKTAEAAKSNEKIEIHYTSVMEEVSGDTAPRTARIKNIKSGETWDYVPPAGECFGVFVFAGYVPATSLFKGLVELDGHGYVITDSNRKTGIDGVYAAGDVCIKTLRQMVTAAADGAIAATEMEKHIVKMQKLTGFVPRQPLTRLPSSAQTPQTDRTKSAASGEEFFTPEIKSQLEGVFAKMEKPLVLRLELDQKPISTELEQFAGELAEMTSKLTVEKKDGSNGETPCIKVCRENGEETGIAFHGVPGGHEFNSFVVGLYNASGPGQALDSALLGRIHTIKEPVNITLLVSLTCTLCPDLVMAAQQIAAISPLVRTDVYDINHFGALKEKYRVMSVPCMVINDNAVSFGKKSVGQILDALGV